MHRQHDLTFYKRRTRACWTHSFRLTTRQTQIHIRMLMLESLIINNLSKQKSRSLANAQPDKHTRTGPVSSICPPKSESSGATKVCTHEQSDTHTDTHTSAMSTATHCDQCLSVGTLQHIQMAKFRQRKPGGRQSLKRTGLDFLPTESNWLFNWTQMMSAYRYL